MSGSALPAWLAEPARASGLLDAVDLRLLDWLCRRVPGGDPSLAATLAALLTACEGGSLCLPLRDPEFSEALSAFLIALGSEPTREAPPAAVLAREFLARAGAGAYDAILGGSADAKPLVRSGDRLYFHRHFHAERILAQGLRARLLLEPQPGDPQRARDVLRAVLEENPLRSGGPESAPLILSGKQQWALAAALRERVFVLSGGPGTGKTALTASWLRALMRLHAPDPERVRLCATTGRAAQRLQESLRAAFASLAPADGSPDAILESVRVETLHRLLGYSPVTGKFARTPDDPLDADWVLLDEASMADVFLMSSLTQALLPGARLVLVGDADQLPAVEAGSILRELLPENARTRLGPATRAWIESVLPEGSELPAAGIAEPGSVASVTLDQSHRSQAPVVRLAKAVNAGDVEAVLGCLGDPLDFSLAFAPEKGLCRFAVPGQDFAEALPRLLERYADAAFLRRRIGGKTYPEWLDAFRTAAPEEEEKLLPVLLEFLDRTRILAPLRHGGLGCGRINTLLRRILEPAFGRGGETAASGFHGAPLLVTRNDAGTGLANGEHGVWLRTRAGLTAFFRRPEGWLRLPAAFLPAHEAGFASTVHKSQGSEYREVLLVLPEAGNRLLARETLYTAVTRARESVRLFASEEALAQAVRNRMIRHSGLRDYFGAP